MNKHVKNSQSLDAKVLARIYGGRGGKGGGLGRVFTPTDFLDLGKRPAIDKVLIRAARAGRIRKLGRGLYDDPRRDETGVLLMPTTDAVIRAIIGRDAIRVQPSGGHAANLLGLSEQVPVRMVFLTDGRGRTVSIGRRKIVLRHTMPRQMATAGRISGTIIQALRWLGRQGVNETVVAKLRDKLAPSDLKLVARDARYAPAWIAEIMRTLARSETV